jgi:chromosome segregation ATPase
MVITLAIVALVAGLVATAFVARARALSNQVAALSRDVETAKAAARDAESAAKKSQKDAEAAKVEAQEVKNDLGAAKKKTHAAQEETKKVREELHAAKRALDEARHSRPAFEPVAAKPAPAPTPAPMKREPTPVAAPSADLLEKVASLESRVEALRGELESEKKVADAERVELRKLRRRHEDQRRIDTITKGKMDALQERLRHLGQQYYDAVSELAHLKGEVPPPPPPREAEPPTETETETEMAAAPSEQ